MRSKPLPVMLVRDLSIYGSAALKITGSTSTKNWSGLISQEDEIIKLHKLCNLHNLQSYVILRRVMRWKPLPVMLVRDLSIYGSAALKITGSTSTKNWSGLISQEDEIIKLHKLCNLHNLQSYVILRRVMRWKPPGNACQGFVHIWKCSTKITGSTSTKNWSGLISQEDEIIKLHKLCNLHNLQSYVILRRVMRWKPPGNACQGFVHIWKCSTKITGSTSTKNWSGLISQEDEIIKLHNLRNPEESDAMETSPGNACQGFVHIWKRSTENYRFH